MTSLKPRSAPSGMKSKFIKNRTSAMKEIQAWVRNNNEYSLTPDVTRNSGQLADNVTEERMLKAKLLELSKERYKFLIQNAYEKKIFEDRQQKKPALRHIFSAPTEAGIRLHSSNRRTSKNSSSITRSAYTEKPQPANVLPGSSSSVDGTLNPSVKFVLENEPNIANENISASQTKTYELNTVSVVNDFPGVRLGQVSNGMKETAQSLDNLHFSSKRNSLTANSMKPAVASGLPQSRLSKTAVNRRISETTLQSQTSASLWSSESPRASKPALWISSLTPSNAVTGSVSSITTSGPSWLSREKPVSKYGQRIESLTSDPRYVFLEQKLSPMLKSEKVIDVDAIVEKKEALHARPRRRTSDTKKSKIEVKALEFMKERGFSF
ncbi:unnamed protein product [Lymnaea stagnalis]|uniref:Uncharacterized protein n=1 Tax=Lymnaea stagnalis TaxID=6523 RepID=A0AAV2HR12_LYMST